MADDRRKGRKPIDPTDPITYCVQVRMPSKMAAVVKARAIDNGVSVQEQMRRAVNKHYLAQVGLPDSNH
jgi:Ribbon-helix-helix protein, copG family